MSLTYFEHDCDSLSQRDEAASPFYLDLENNNNEFRSALTMLER